MKGMFSLSVLESKYFNDNQDKFEIVGGCPRKYKDCREQLLFINESYLTSGRKLREKDYQGSIEALKSAFYKTKELQEPFCIKCADLFRSNITKSLELIYEDLHKMSTGIFRSKRFQSSFELASIVLAEFNKEI
jgi:hypothetical protein